MKPWKDIIDAIGQQVVGTSRVKLEQIECSSRECNLGNFFTDAMVHAFTKVTPYDVDYWSNVSIAFTGAGNFRVPLEPGVLTYNHLTAMCPFENKLVAFNLYGKDLLEVLETGIYNMRPEVGRASELLQFSGLKVVFNVTNPSGHRVTDVKVRCQKCQIPIYEPLKEDNIYRVATLDYLANGNGGWQILKERGFDLEEGPKDIDALIDYIQSIEPVTTGNEGRFKIVK